MNTPQLNKVNDYQLRQILKTISGSDAVFDTDGYPSIPDVLGSLYSYDKIRLPCEADQLFVIYERFPVFNDIQRTPRSSILLSQLFDRPEETGVVVDSVLSGKHALFLARLLRSKEAVKSWLDCMSEMATNLTIRQIDNENKVIIAPLLSFVTPRDEA